MTASILITGASGQLGKLVVAQLLAQGAKPESIAVLVRSKDKGEQFQSKGVDVRIGDYTDEASLKQAVQGISRALLISGTNVGNRLVEHSNFIQALKQSGTPITLLAYTSILYASTSPIVLAVDHKATEEALEKSGLPYTSLRNGWYIENVTRQIGGWIATGSILGASGQGRISAASRNDYAEATAKILLSKEAPVKNIYELGGKPGYTLDELAALATKVIGKPIKAVHLSKADYISALNSAGVPASLAELVGDADDNASKGYLEATSGDLQTLLGRPNESIEDVIRAALA